MTKINKETLIESPFMSIRDDKNKGELTFQIIDDKFVCKSSIPVDRATQIFFDSLEQYFQDKYVRKEG